MTNESEVSDMHKSESEAVFDDDARPPSRKRSRKRKKSIYKPLVEQMEFYMGDANVSRSKFMKEEMQKSPWVDLDVFLTFNKLNWMLRESFGHADNTNDLLVALKAIPSEVYEVREDDIENNIKRGVKRKNPFPVTLDARANDNKTIYVERIPPHVDIDSLKHVFEKYGPVSYISLPKFKHNGIPKGFAFLEFEQEEGANKALEAFILQKRRISTALDPSALQSIQAFHEEQEHDLQESTEGTSENKTDSVPEKKEESEVKPSAEQNIESEDDATENKASNTEEKKAKRKRKRKNNDVHNNQHDLLSSKDLLSLVQIMPRFEWKRLRNKYLNLQRKNMSHSKMRLKQYHERRKGTPSRVPDEDAEEGGDGEGQEKQLEFTPGIIVKFLVEEPIDDEKTVKKRIKAAIMENVKYVDVQVGAKEYHVRCAHADMAKTLSKAKILGQATILDGEDEQKYWEKIKKDRDAKLSGKVKVKSGAKRARGQDRLTKKIQMMNQTDNKHTYFDDE